MGATIRPRDLTLAILVAVVWGFAFVLTKTALGVFSAPQLVALRFAIAALPAIVLARSNVPWRALIPLGMTLFAGQFLFQFLGIANGMPAGLAAVVVQTQAIFTVVLAAGVLGERPGRRELAGIALACIGLGCIAATVGQGLTLIGLSLTLVSPLSFAIGNILLKQLGTRYGKINMLNLMTWLSVVPPLPMYILSLYYDGPGGLPAAVMRASWIELGALFYLGTISVTFGYAVWGNLLSRYSAAQVSPFALLVPFVAAAASALVLGEQFGPLQVTGMAFVVAGLACIAVPSAAVRHLRQWSNRAAK